MHRGEVAARKQWASLLALKKKIGIADTFVPQSRAQGLSRQEAQTLLQNVILPQNCAGQRHRRSADYPHCHLCGFPDAL